MKKNKEENSELKAEEKKKSTPFTNVEYNSTLFFVT